jgi:hypothetical protein
MGERETLIAPDAGVNWQRRLKPLLNTYLRRLGISSAEIRTGWVEHVLLELQLHQEDISSEDILQLAVEWLRELIDARLARMTNLDPVHERREIAGVLALLGDPRYAGLANSVFEDYGSDVDPEVRAQLLEAIARDRPRSQPPAAPLAMPTQTIRLRSLPALLRRLRGTE